MNKNFKKKTLARILTDFFALMKKLPRRIRKNSAEISFLFYPFLKIYDKTDCQIR